VAATLLDQIPVKFCGSPKSKEFHMRTIRLIPFLACSLFLSALSHADCIKDERSSKTSGLLISEFNLAGTQALSSEEVSDITSGFVGSCFNDDSEELGEWIRAAFQNRGYFMVLVKNVRIKAEDPLNVPKPVAVEAEVTEGPRCKFGEIRFTGDHAFSSDKLLAEFPVKKGSVFERDKIAHGLESVMKLYLANGHLEATMVPNTRFIGESVALNIDVDEGPQFRMGKLQIFAKGEQADKLRAAWGISEGTVFDDSYLEKYIESNRALMPANFTRQSVQVVHDCRQSTVEVRLPIDPLDPRSLAPAKDVDCESRYARTR
jgi:outer membrane protein assembly factor BamA